MGPFRPASFSNPAAGGDAAASSGVSGGAEHGALNSLDIHGAHTVAPALNGSEAAHLATAGSHATGAAVGHAAMAAMPVGGEPVSPLIQLIMRMPGALGMGTSFFEWLSHMFMPGAHDLMPGIDPLLLHSQIGGHMAALQHLADVGGESLSNTLSSLTSDVPVFHNLAHAANGIGGDLDVSSVAAAPSADHFVPNPDNLGGPTDAGTAQFEGAHSGESALAGPSISNPGTGNYLAGNHRLFGDHIGNPNAGNPNAANTITSSTSVPSTGSMPSTVSGATFGQEASQMPAAHAPTTSLSGPAVGDNGGMQLAGRAQPSFESGSSSSINPNNTIASDVPSYRPTSGSYYAPAANGSPSGVDGGSAVEPLKAKQLTFDDIRKGAGAAHTNSVMDHIGHQSKAGMQPSSSSIDATSHRALPKAYTTSVGSHDVTPSSPATHASHPTAHASHPTHTASAGHQKIASVSHAGDASGHIQPHAAESAHHAASARGAQNAEGAQSADGTQSSDATSSSDATHSSDATQSTDTTQSADATKSTDATQPAEYTVEKGDSLWNIAQKNLGDGSKWTEIYKLNQDSIGQNPDLIFSGNHLKLPGASGSSIADASHYTVKPGDNLWNIAKSHLGNPTKWGDLYKANANIIGDNPGLIQPGQDLTLPSVNPAIAQAPAAVGPTAVAPQTISSAAPAGAGGGFEQQASFGHPIGGPMEQQAAFGQTAGMEQHAATAMQPQGFEAQAAAPHTSHPVGFERSAGAAAAQAPRFEAQSAVAPISAPTSQFQVAPLDAHPVPGVSLSAGEGIPVSSNGMIQVAPAKDLPVGPGAAGAATLKAGSDAIVSGSLAPDLSFLSKKIN